MLIRKSRINKVEKYLGILAEETPLYFGIVVAEVSKEKISKIGFTDNLSLPGS